MSFDGIVTKAIVNELNQTIISSRVEKIYVPTKNEILFNLHINKEKYKLLICIEPSNGRLHLTKNTKENPAKASQFCMVLRKHLQGAKIISISQYKLDRIVEMNFENIDEFGDTTNKKLIIELMGKHSNAILLNSNNRIIDSLVHVDSSMSSLREILPAHEYYYPENQDRINFEGMSLDDFYESIQIGFARPTTTEITFPDILANEFMGFSRTFTNNICKNLQLKNIPSNSDITRLYSSLSIMFYNINQNMVELINLGKDYHLAVGIYSTHENHKLLLSNFIDEFYSNKESNEKLKNAKSEIQKEVTAYLSKYRKNLSRANEILNESSNAEKYKMYGELISSNIYRMKPGLNEIEVENFYDNNNLITIPLNESYSPSRNAQNYFKKYTKLKNSILHATIQKEDYQKNIDYLETVSFQINECKDIEELKEIKYELTNEKIIKEKILKKFKEKKMPSKPLEFDFKGTKILVGKNNTQNDKLTLKEANKMYTWLHTKNVHGSHVIIANENVTDEILLYAAKLAVEHSKAKDSSKVAVDYTLVKNVHKPLGSKPGVVIYTDYKTIIV